MLKWLAETYYTLSVVTFHPIGWGLKNLRRRFVRNQDLNSQAICQEKQSPTLLVHGVLHNSSAFYSLSGRLRSKNFTNIKTIELMTSVRSLESLVAQLKDEVRKHYYHAGAPLKVRIVCHSLGGIVTRLALLDPDFAKCCDKVIFLGVPHQGRRFFLPWPRSLFDLFRKEEFMKTLREQPLAGSVRYWNLRGSLDLVTPKASTFLPHVPNLDFEGVGHAGLLSNPLVLETVVEILATPIYDEKSDERQPNSAAS